jgi:hypothetical protein
MDVEQTGGNPQDLPEKMNEDRWYYAIGLFKIIKEYVPRDKGTVGDNTVLLFQYMFLGYMYDLHDEDVIDYVEKYLKSSSIEQSATDYKSPAKQVYTFQPDIPEKRTLPYDNSKQYVPDDAIQVKQVQTLQPSIQKKRTLPYDNSKQYVPDDAIQVKQVQTLQPSIQKKRTLPYDNSKQQVPDDATQTSQKSHTRSPHNIQQSVSKDTHTDVYNNNYNGIGYTATSIPIPIMVGGKQNTTKFMKNVIKDFKKLFV